MFFKKMMMIRKDIVGTDQTQGHGVGCEGPRRENLLTGGGEGSLGGFGGVI